MHVSMFTTVVIMKLLFLLCCSIHLSFQKLADYSIDAYEDCQGMDVDAFSTEMQNFDDDYCTSFSQPHCCFIAYVPGTTSGIYSIENTNVYCDINGGWMTFLRRSRNLDSAKFNQPWKRYTRKRGFGVLPEDHWKGLDLLHLLTETHDMELQIELWNYNTDDPVVLIQYDSFHVGGRDTDYQLTLGTFSGNLSLNGFSDHNNSRFSTRDWNRNDGDDNCAQAYGGGWWYHQCYSFLPTGTEKPIQGEGFEQFSSIEMKIRSTNCMD